ncbi:putative Zn finger-like uncharacterized protein [Methylovorus glucosotrophus]|uniref:zinc-ribbon and DUF3426 domain-containing protein n=1 Tax=Methylovorus glucosotrophus TaxID=266009 RepID=UPI001331AE93|nr:zinc-ribbon and DUF3426 domain-containing protein [Methylovorus glucosotrophus]KAF0842640.1 putative Zn finger-like uncharacterized protein [Methylovorus glucosotrophus]
MSLITSCPACSTVFHVKPEQLSLRRGIVRCGECQHVFNALDHLHEAETVAPETVAPETAVPETAVPETVAPETAVPETAVPETAVPETAVPETAVPEAVVPEAVVPEAQPHAAEAHITHQTAPHIPAQPSWHDAAPKSKLQTVLVQPKTVPWLSGLFALLLVITIALQLAYFQRNALALAWPESKPYLQQACAMLNCKIELPRDASKLVIDDANLLEDSDYEGLLILTSTLINQARHVQAYPQLELTLTDANDQAVLRRTFTPAEYLPAGTVVEKGIPAGKELPIKLLLTADHQTVSGYRLFVNY